MSQRETALQRGWQGRCPRCGDRGIFRSRYRLHDRCPQCGLALELEDGWSYGSVPLAYALACVVWVTPVVLLYFFNLLPLGVTAVVGVLGVIVLPVVTFRFTKGLWVGLYYYLLPQEMRERQAGEKGDHH